MTRPKRYLCVECGAPTNGARCGACNCRHVGHTWSHPKAPPGRALELAVLYRGGCTLQEIGDAVGLSRERVRQLIRSVGEPTRHHHSSCVAPLTQQVTQQRHAKLGVIRQRRQQARLKQVCARFAQAVEAVRILAATLGRSPTLGEVARAVGLRIQAGQVGGHLRGWLCPGSTAATPRARDVTFALYDTAGVPQRGRGGRGHTTGPHLPGARAATCRRGHAEWYALPHGKRKCAVCHRESKRRRYAALKAARARPETRAKLKAAQKAAWARRRAALA